MIGLPTETFEDLSQIVTLANKIVDLYYSLPREKRNGKCTVTVSTSTFVPKPHTPFEWFGQNTLDKIELKQQFLKDNLKNKSIKYSWHNPQVSRLEALVSRGDDKVCDIIYEAFKNGAKFDSWEEYLNVDAWEKAAEKLNINISDYANKEYDLDYKFKWDNIMHGVTKEFLKRENNKAIKEETTLNCQKNCSACGVTQITECNFLNKFKLKKGE